MENTDRPGRLSQVTFHGPLSSARAAQLTERLTRNHPGTVLDIGCGWGELMLRILAAAPNATGVGIDLDDDDLNRSRVPPGLDRDGDRGGVGRVRVGLSGRRGGVARRPTPITPRPPRSGSASTSTVRTGCAATAAC
jgi:hypothetical protein